MDQPGDPLDEPEEIELDFMDCPECAEMAEIGAMTQFFTVEGQNVFSWRTLCLQGHHLDNFWFYTEVGAAQSLVEKPDVTPPGS